MRFPSNKLSNQPIYDIIKKIVNSAQTAIDITYNTLTGLLGFEVLVDDAGIEVNEDNELQLKDDGVTRDKINVNVAGTNLYQNVDGSLAIKNASTSILGVTLLSNEYNGTAEDKAVTEKALSDGLVTVVPKTTTITINEEEYDLSENRSWTLEIPGSWQVLAIGNIDGGNSASEYPEGYEIPATDIIVDSTAFSGNLSIDDDTVQKVANKLDTLSVGGGDFNVGEYAKNRIVEIIQNVCDAANIKGLWIFDEDGATTTIPDLSGKGHDLTLSANANTLSPNNIGLWQSSVLDITSSAYFETADHDDFSFGNGTTDSPFSVIVLVNLNIAPNTVLLTKANYTTGNTGLEWQFQHYSVASGGYLNFSMMDDSTTGRIGRRTGLDSALDEGSWHVYGGTYSGNRASTGIKIYRDGIRVDAGDNNSGSYTAMENKAGTVGNFQTGTDGSRWNLGNYKAGLILITAGELTAFQVNTLSRALLQYV